VDIAQWRLLELKFDPMMIPKRTLTKEQAYQKLRHYCAYQDRCHADVKTKAWSLGIKKTDVEELTSRLIEEGCLNEERYARSFAGGKFRMKQWGKVKIKQGLSFKQVSAYCIRKALQEIPDEEYFAALKKLAEVKWKSLRQEKNILIKLRKTQDYLLQKGYESELVRKELEALRLE